MAEGKRRDPGAQLEELNDQLARFLQHADQLLEDWARFGAQVRATVDIELGRIESGAAEAADRATKQLGGQVDKVAHERVERAIGEGLARIKLELDRAGKGTAVVAPLPTPPNRALLGAVVLANLLLIALLALTFRRDGGRPAPVVVALPDAALAVEIPTEVTDACAGLLEVWSDDDAAIVLRAGLAACGPYAKDVGSLFQSRLTVASPIDAGVIDAAPPLDAKRRSR